jgi:hypothetical protein
MELGLVFRFLAISCLFICVVFCTSEGSLEAKRPKNEEKVSSEEKMMRNTLDTLPSTLTNGGDISIPTGIVDIMPKYYNEKVTWKTKRIDAREVEGKQFENNVGYLYVSYSQNDDPITRNGRKLFYDKESKESKDLIIQEAADCPNNPMGVVREKSLGFIVGETEEEEDILLVYLGNRFLVIHGWFKKEDNDDDDDFYGILDIYDLSDPEFWKAEFKANSRGKAVLCGDEGYGIHIECASVDSVRQIGRNVERGRGRRICNNCSSRI